MPEGRKQKFHARLDEYIKFMDGGSKPHLARIRSLARNRITNILMTPRIKRMYITTKMAKVMNMDKKDVSLSWLKEMVI
jgi:hypothetical protein